MLSVMYFFENMLLKPFVAAVPFAPTKKLYKPHNMCLEDAFNYFLALPQIVGCVGTLECRNHAFSAPELARN